MEDEEEEIIELLGYSNYYDIIRSIINKEDD